MSVSEIDTEPAADSARSDRNGEDVSLDDSCARAE